MSRDIEAKSLSRMDASVEFRYDSRIDLPALIRTYLGEYLALDLEKSGHCNWERPSVFVHEMLAELSDTGFGPDDGESIVDRTFSQNPEVEFWWTEDHWDALLTVCPEADPNYRADPVDAARVPGPLDVPLPF